MRHRQGTGSGANDGVVNRRKPYRLFSGSSERKNPCNVQFERQVARLESRQQQQRSIVYIWYPSFHAENGNNHLSSEATSPEDSLGLSIPFLRPILVVHVNVPDESLRKYPDNPSRLLLEKSTPSNNTSNSDFLVSSFAKTSVDARHGTRKKSKKKTKKDRQRCRKPTNGSEIECAENYTAAPSTDTVDCEGLTLSPKHVGDIVFDDAFSPSSSVKEASEKTPDSENDNDYHGCSAGSLSSVSYCDETDLSGPTTSCLELFGKCNSSSSYLDKTPNSEFMVSPRESCYCSRSGNYSDNTKRMLVLRNEDSCGMTEVCSPSARFDEVWLENSNRSSGHCSQNGVGIRNGVQSVHLCRDGSSDSDFHLVISRKRARKEKKMSLWKSYHGERASAVTHGRNEKYGGHSSRQMIGDLSNKNCSHRENHIGQIQPQHGGASKHPTKNFIHKQSNGVPLKDSKSVSSHNHFTSPKENNRGKSNSDFNKEQHSDLNKCLSNTLRTRDSNCCETRSSSASEPTTPKSAASTCTSESVKSTDYTAAAFSIQKIEVQASLPVNCAGDTGSGQPSPDSKSSRSDSILRCGADSSIELNHSFRKFRSSEMHLVEMIKVANDAYGVQVAADVHLAAGHPITDLEIFMYSATPVIGHVRCMKIGNCSGDQFGSYSVSQQNISNVSLRSIWEWYEEPGCYGLEVRGLNDLGSRALSYKNSDFCAYFVPYLSAIQLFGRSTKNMDNRFGVEEGDLLETSNTMSSHPVPAQLHKPFDQSSTCFSESSFSAQDDGELIFEYFETEQPASRPPLYVKVKELATGLDVSDHRILGDPKKLQSVKLCDLHPASWFCVAWYPVYRVPHGNLRAAFLTYHSLGKLVAQKCSSDLTGQCTRIVSPVVGLQTYNDKGEQWFQLRCPDSSKASGAEVLKERLRTLRRGALTLARAVVPKGTESSMNHHPDYEFFLSRSA